MTKDGLKMGCENGKLFLSESLLSNWFNLHFPAEMAIQRSPFTLLFPFALTPPISGYQWDIAQSCFKEDLLPHELWRRKRTKSLLTLGLKDWS
jgi:hypothetical protein